MYISQRLIQEIIPPKDYKHRNGFNNVPILERLTRIEKEQLEVALIDMLVRGFETEIDILIVETLSYLQSQKSLPILKRLFDNCEDETIKLKIASSIFEISKNEKIVDEAIAIFNQIKNNDPKNPYYNGWLIDALYQLSKFKNERTNGIIRQYINDKDYLIGYNAKRFLSGDNK